MNSLMGSPRATYGAEQRSAVDQDDRFDTNTGGAVILLLAVACTSRATCSSNTSCLGRKIVIAPLAKIIVGPSHFENRESIPFEEQKGRRASG